MARLERTRKDGLGPGGLREGVAEAWQGGAQGIDGGGDVRFGDPAQVADAEDLAGKRALAAFDQRVVLVLEQPVELGPLDAFGHADGGDRVGGAALAGEQLEAERLHAASRLAGDAL